MSNENLKHEENCRAYSGQVKKLVGERKISGEYFNGKKKNEVQIRFSGKFLPEMLYFGVHRKRAQIVIK